MTNTQTITNAEAERVYNLGKAKIETLKGLRISFLSDDGKKYLERLERATSDVYNAVSEAHRAETHAEAIRELIKAGTATNSQVVDLEQDVLFSEQERNRAAIAADFVLSR